MDERIRTFVINSLAQAPIISREYLKEVEFTRFFVKELKEAIGKSGQRIFLIAGLRGTGKTTALYQLFQEGDMENTAYFTCDELLSREMQLEDVITALDMVKRQSVGTGKRFLILLDEITYLDKWDLKLKVLSDKRPNLTIVATSSSSLPLKKTKELARRAYEISALPLSFREYLSLKHKIDIKDEISEKIRKKIGKESLEGEYISVRATMGNHDLFGLYEEYVHHDLPSALSLSDQAYADAVVKTLKRTIYEDFAKYGKFESKMLVAAEILVKYLATIPAEGVKISSLSEVCNVSKESIANLLDTLELSMVVKGVEHSGRNRKYKKPKKWFFYSSSMRHILASPVISSSEITGNLREDSVFRHLSSIFANLFYSHEADFIADGLEFEVGKNKKPRKGVVSLGIDEGIAVDRIPIPLFALAV